MRWIFYTLAIANIAVFLWQFSYNGDSEKAVGGSTSMGSEEAPKAQSILLLSEVRDLAVPTEASLPRKMEVVAAGAVGEVVDEVLPNFEKEANGDSLKNGVAELCGIFGPFVDERESERFSQSLSNMNLSPEIIREEMAGPGAFWVYIMPFSSAGGALGMINNLKEYGIESFLINEGKLTNGLSLGVFEQQARVSEIIRRMEELDLDIKVEEKTRSYHINWVVLRLEKLEIAESELLAKMLEIYPLIKYRQKVCKSVASAD